MFAIWIKICLKRPIISPNLANKIIYDAIKEVEKNYCHVNNFEDPFENKN